MSEILFAPILERLTQRAVRQGDYPRETLALMRVDERPTSYVGRVAVLMDDETRPRTHYFVKILKCPAAESSAKMQRRVKREYTALTEVRELFAGVDGMSAVRPVAVYEDLLASVTEEVKGKTLLEVLPTATRLWSRHRHRSDSTVIMKRAGQWVRRLQSLTPSAEKPTIRDLEPYIDVRLSLLEQSGSSLFDLAWRNRVLAHVGALTKRLSPTDTEPRFAHGDLSLGNLIWTGDSIVGLDFAMTQPAPWLYDLTRLSLQLDLLCTKPQTDRAFISVLKRSLLLGFSLDLTEEHPLFRVLTLLHRVNHLASMVLKKSTFPFSLYNRMVARGHYNWIAAETRKGWGR